MADPQSAAKIRDLEQRMAAMPGSRIFVGLAEEYRRAGRFSDALATLRAGLEAHPSYLSARIAIARLYQEMGRNEEAMDAFARVLASDRENLVAAKALGDLHARLGNAVEAVKKYKLYRALAGDKAIDEKIAALEAQARAETAAAPALPAPDLPPASEARLFDPLNFPGTVDFTIEPDNPTPLTLSTLDFEPSAEPPLAIETTRPFRVDAEAIEMIEPSTGVPEPGSAFPPADGPGDSARASSPPASAEAGPDAPMGSLSALSLAPEAVPAPSPAPPAPSAVAPPEEPVEAAPLEQGPADEPRSAEEEPADEDLPVAVDASGEIPAARTLAALYEKQGFSEDARRIYDRLGDEPAAAPGAASLPEAESSPVLPTDPVARKRQALESWLARVKARAVESQ